MTEQGQPHAVDCPCIPECKACEWFGCHTHKYDGHELRQPQPPSDYDPVAFEKWEKEMELRSDRGQGQPQQEPAYYKALRKWATWHNSNIPSDAKLIPIALEALELLKEHDARQQERQAGAHVHAREPQPYEYPFYRCKGCDWSAHSEWWWGYDQGVADAAASDRNWAERIEIAKQAREGGRILREKGDKP